MVDFSPSIMAADLLHLQKEVLQVKTARYLHIDVMDGHFVPNITMGPGFVQAFQGKTPHLMDVHLMVERPEAHVEAFIEAGAAILTVHVEATTHLHRVLTVIKKRGVKAGVALNPHTPISHITGILELLDVVLIMSVNPGFSGQKFIYATLKKIEELQAVIQKEGFMTRIQVDGGIDTRTAPQVVQAGAQILVAGSSIFQTNNPAQAFLRLQESVDENG